MQKLYPVEENQRIVGYVFDCPGCELGHMVHVAPEKNELGASWTFNGNWDAPTFSPSILSRVAMSHKTMVCHIFVRDGKIQFLSDCTHRLAGKTVDMLDIEN